METRARSLVKAVSWQMIGLVTMSAIGTAFTGSLASGSGLALASTCVGFFSFILHERVWARVLWGRKPEGPAIDSTQTRHRLVPQ